VVESVITGTISGNSLDFRYQNANAQRNNGLNVIVRSGTLTTPPTFGDRGVDSRDGNQWVAVEDYGGVLGAHYTFFANGDAIKNTATVRTGGADSSIEVIPLSSCDTANLIPFLTWTEVDVAASAQVRGIYILGEGWTTFPTAAELWFEVEYLNHASLLTKALLKSTHVLTDNVTWTKLSASFTPAQAGNVRYRAYLGRYEVGAKIYVDNQLQTI
jgi:hypothetical protein